MEALESRLRSRATESEEDIVKRLGNAAKELEYGQTEGNFDKVFVNDDLEKTANELVEFFRQAYPHLDYVADETDVPSNTVCNRERCSVM